MEIEVKNRTERCLMGYYQFLPKLREDVSSYIKTFSPEGKEIHEYTHVSFIFEAFGILTRFYPADKKNITDFIIKISDYVIRDFESLPPGHVNTFNNFQSHRLKVVSTAGHVLKMDKYLNWCEKEIKNFINLNLKADGSTEDFHLRDSLTYSVYTLEPLVECCLNLWKSGKIIYFFFVSPQSKGSVFKSVRSLIPYIKGTKKNTMFIKSVYASDKSKQEYAKTWDPSNAQNLINLAINFDRTLIGLYGET
jgi:Alginate lyase